MKTIPSLAVSGGRPSMNPGLGQNGTGPSVNEDAGNPQAQSRHMRTDGKQFLVNRAASGKHKQKEAL